MCLVYIIIEFLHLKVPVLISDVLCSVQDGLTRRGCILMTLYSKKGWQKGGWGKPVGEIEYSCTRTRSLSIHVHVLTCTRTRTLSIHER